MAVIDATDLVLGRMASGVATRILKGERIDIVNAQNAVITGEKKAVVEKFRGRFDLHAKGNPEKAPKFSKMPDKIVRSSIRGMLPWKKPFGKKAFKNLRVYIGVPKEFKKSKLGTIENAKVHADMKYMKISELSAEFGFKGVE